MLCLCSRAGAAGFGNKKRPVQGRSGACATAWCHVAVSQHVWLSEEMPAAFLPKPGSAGTHAKCGQPVPNSPPLEGLC